MGRLVVKFVLLLVFALAPSAAFAFTIQDVKSPGGITAWLVEDHAVPLLAISYSFRVGNLHDPEGKEGVTEFVASMLDEGAGDLTSDEFQRRRDELAMRMRFTASKDTFEGSFQTLARNREASLELLRLAITSPRFDQEPLERVRQQLLINVRDKAKDPEHMAINAWMDQIIPGDPYTREGIGTEASLAGLTVDDLRAAHGRIFARGTLQVAVVGDITAAELGPMLDELFGGLPMGEAHTSMADIKPAAGPSLKVIDREMPQSLIIFGHEGIRRGDPDFIPAYVMTEILGGGGFNSRLTKEVREKRGLTYGVGFGLSPMERGGFMIGSLQTANETAGEALEVVRDVIARMAEEGPTQPELDEAKTFLTGSYALRFSGGDTIASQLLGIQQENLGVDYISRRNSLVEAVTLDQAKAQAKRLLHPDRMIVTVVGKPQGLKD